MLSVCKYWVTALFSQGESDSTNQSASLFSLGSQTNRSATAPAVMPLAPVFNKLPPNPTPLRYFCGPINPVKNCVIPAVNSPRPVSGL